MGTQRTRGVDPQAHKGQSLPEFLVAIPLFLFLILLIFQLTLIYRAKTTLDYAALEAARVGAVTGADADAMRNGLIRGMTPLYATSAGVGGTVEAYARARLDIQLRGQANIDIISPTADAMARFRELQYDGRYALPNDNLAYRPVDEIGGGVNVQDANILKIRVDYNFPLIVPFVDRVMRGDSRYVPSSGFFDPGNVDLVAPLPFIDRHFRIPLRSYAIVRMQSPIYEDAVALPSLP